MENIATLKRKIESAGELHSVISTMKALAAVSIKQYEQAQESIEEYYRAIVIGLQFALQRGGARSAALLAHEQVHGTKDAGGILAIIFGSDQGMCGQFNREIVEYALEQLPDLNSAKEQLQIANVGSRAAPYLVEAGAALARDFELPGSLHGINALVQQILLFLGAPRSQVATTKVLVFFNSRERGSVYRPCRIQVFPFDLGKLPSIEKRPGLPFYRVPAERLMPGLIRQYLFVSFYRACVASMQSENASRLATMQAAEKNIEERIEDLHKTFGHVRQETITSELLDIVSGYEALMG